eukprot:1712525-Amphidinium_carterae.1
MEKKQRLKIRTMRSQMMTKKHQRRTRTDTVTRSISTLQGAVALDCDSSPCCSKSSRADIL